MPRIFDSRTLHLRSALAETMRVAYRADCCAGYFNLLGWRSIDAHVETWADGPGRCCRLLVGMQRLPHEELRAARRLSSDQPAIDNQAALRFKTRLAEEFREQLTLGAPTNQDGAGLHSLARQIKARKVVVKLFLGYSRLPRFDRGQGPRQSPCGRSSTASAVCPPAVAGDGLAERDCSRTGSSTGRWRTHGRARGSWRTGAAAASRSTTHVPDALLPAPAASRGLAVLTRNTSEFRNTGVETVNPWTAAPR